MAETLLAILLVTSSAEKSTVAFRWPAHPNLSPRLVRQPPSLDLSRHTDIPWKASHCDSPPFSPNDLQAVLKEEGFECEWRRPGFRSSRKSRSRHRRDNDSRPHSRHASPHTHMMDDFPGLEEHASPEYGETLGFTTRQLGNLLTPTKRSLFHQKFELVVDDLVFIGHPVCRGEDGWGPRTAQPNEEPIVSDSRGRTTTPKNSSSHPNSRSQSKHHRNREKRSILDSFHLVFVLDHPDPSSAASGNLSKYFNQIYEHVVFPVTAVLFQEQVLKDFVERECYVLNKLEDQSILDNEPYSKYESEALVQSTCVRAMKTLFEAIKSWSIAQIELDGDNSAFEVQLPPYLDSILHTETDQDYGLGLDDDNEEDSAPWGRELEFGWQLPSLTPWKSILLTDPVEIDVLAPDNGEVLESMPMRGLPPNIAVARDINRFLQEVSITLNLRDMGELLDWSLLSHVYPIVRWLIFHRRAKVVNVVHRSLKTVFSVPPRLPGTLRELEEDYDAAFGSKDVPTLPEVLSRLTMNHGTGADEFSNSHQHFYSIFVRSKDRVPLFFDVVTWLLKRDLIQAMHLRIRVVVSRDIKQRVHLTAMRRKEARLRKHDAVFGSSSSDDAIDSSLSLHRRKSPVHQKHGPTDRSSFNRRATMENIAVHPNMRNGSGTESEDVERAEDEIDDLVLKAPDDRETSTLLYNPGRATPVQRRWLKAMTEGKDKSATQLFDKINQYFDGRKSDDEILFRAEISRKQLRHVLHHFEDHLLTFLHP